MKKKGLKRGISFLLVLNLVFTLIGLIYPKPVIAAVILKSSVIRDSVLAKVGQNYPNGYCLKFVEECYQNLGATRPYSCCASKSGNLFIRSTSSSDIPIGATVYFGNCGGGPCRSCWSSYYGHVGIYVGDGYFVHATGGKVQKSTINSWKNKYRGYGYCGNFNLDQNLANTNAQSILPGTVDTTWNVPANITASHKITTYDQWGNAESNHYIDPGDNCYISEVYTNGFVKVKYPTPSGDRWAYAKASDFDLSKAGQSKPLPDTRLHAWFSTEPMGKTENRIRLNDTVYLCYRVETMDGKLLDSSTGNYTVTETIYFPDGTSTRDSYENNNNWIRDMFNQWGTYRGVVEISGDYTGKSEVSWTIAKPNKILLSTWFSSTKMGNEVSCLEKGKTYYFCYSARSDNAEYLNQIANLDYSVTEEVYGPDGKKIVGYTHDNSDKNCIMFTASQSGNYKGVVTIQGDFSANTSRECVSKDMSIPKLQSISISTYPKKMTYTVGEKLDTSGMVVTAYYSNKTQKKVTNYKVSGNTDKAGSVGITVSYTEGGITKTGQFLITVKEKSKQTVTITYDPKGGTLSKKTQTVTQNSFIKLLSEKPKKIIKVTFDSNGGSSNPASMEIPQKFIDWVYIKDGSEKHFQSGQMVYVYENSKVSANYEPAKISSLPSVKKSGYTFDGWYTTSNQKAYAGMILVSDTKLVAHWTKQQKASITISYDSCGGDWSQKKQQAIKNEKCSLLKGYPKKDYQITLNANGGKVSQQLLSIPAPFLGWYTLENGKGTRYTSGQKVSFNKDITLYAAYGVSKIGELPVPEKKGYIFDGWYTQNRIKVSANTTISEDCVLTASWKEEAHVHTPSEWIVVREATVTETGQKQIICQECEAVLDTESIPILPNGDGNIKDDLSEDELQEDKLQEENFEDENENEDEDEPLCVGDEITTDYAIYTITKTSGTPTVEYTELFDEDVTKVVIPSTVVMNGVTYKVTSVSSKACYKNNSIKSVTIGKNVTKIGSKAFYGCTFLKKITVVSEKIKSGNIGSRAFSKIAKNVKVYVPSAKYKSYKKMLKKAGIGSKAKIYKHKD